MGQGGLEDIEKATNDLLRVSSLPPVFLALCASFSASASPSPSFPLTHPLMVIYLVGKGFAFSPERSTTGRERTPSSLAQIKGKEEESRCEQERDKRMKKNIYISFMSVSPVTPALPPTLPHSCNGSEGFGHRQRGERKRITSQYLFLPAAWIETDTLHSLSLFPP